ncbi:MAG: flavodoxin family protein, partial [Burkholderiaceae bacterium]
TGGTEQLVEAACDGARAAVSELAHDTPAQPMRPVIDVMPVRCDRLSASALSRADALIVATPECLASVAGPMKAFFDRVYYPALDTLNGRPYAAMVCAGTDGQGALRQIDRIATGWRLRRVAEPVLAITGAQAPDAILAPKSLPPADLARAGELGATLAAGLLLGLW